jgi:starch synthase (maltosyl-transferring)
MSPDQGNSILVIVNVDPHHMQHGWVRIRAADFNPSGDLPLVVHDLLTDATYVWRGEWNYVRLDPADLPAHILHVRTP